MKLSGIVLLLPLLTGCASLIGTLPPPPDGQSIGTRQVVLKTCLIEANSKPSCPPIDLLVQAWYPASGPGQGPAPYLQDPEPALDTLSDDTGVPRSLLKRVAEIKTHAGLNAPLAQGQYPLIVFSHGYKSLRMQNTALLERYASEGYVVLAVQHSYDALQTSLPDGRVIKPAAQPPEDANLYEEDALRGSWTDRRVGEIRAVIDQMQLLPHDLRGAIDPKRIAVIGHSMGGSTATAVCREDQKVAACVNFDGPLRGERQKADLIRPVLLVEAANPQYQNAEQEKLYKERLAEFKSSAKAGYIYVRVEDTGHLSFTDFPLIAKAPLRMLSKHSGELDGKESLELCFELSRSFIDAQFANQRPWVPQTVWSRFTELKLVDQKQTTL